MEISPSNMSGEAQIEALLEIINKSAREAIAEYKKGGHEVPTIHSKDYHPIDFAIDTVALKKAVRLLEGATQQLCASLAPPQHTVHNFAMSFEGGCIEVALRAHVADALAKYPKGLHIDELASMVGLEKGKLTRVLRLLATKGCFIEVEPNVFANNRISLITLSSSNPGVLSRMTAERCPQGIAVLYETMTKPEYATSYDPMKAPFIYALKKKGFEGSLFDWIKHDSERSRDFHRAMIGVSQVVGSLSVLHYYPWNEIKTVCDVGAGAGAVSLPLARMYPHLKITNQDLPEVLVRAKDVWSKDAPEVLQRNQVEFIPFNFFEQSPVQGQDVYYLRHIMHDWPDTEASVIMRNVRQAMGPHSRLLIHDYLLTPASHDPNSKSYGVDVAPEPMLPNFGNGNNRMYQQDLNMWLLLNAKERTLSELLALGSVSGLRLEKVYDLAESSVLEFRIDVQWKGVY